MKLDIDALKDKYPFLSLVQVGKFEHVGIIQNADIKVLSMYCFESVPKLLVNDFLNNGSEWWWESNRKLPINIFIGKKFDKFKISLKTYSTKDCNVVFGPVTKLTDLTKDRRIRRKTIQLVRRVK
jgi:hypothetical protein